MLRVKKGELIRRNLTPPKYHLRGLLCNIEDSEESQLVLRAYQFHNLTFHGSNQSLFGRLIFSGNELFIPAVINKTLEDGIVAPLEIETATIKIQGSATICRLTDEIIVPLPHQMQRYDNVELLFGREEKFEVYHPRGFGEVGGLVERFLYRAGGENNWHFRNTKTNILHALGIQNAESLGEQYHLDGREALRYNLRLERDEERDKKP